MEAKDKIEIWVQIISAGATLLAVVVALFGETIKYKFFPPVLDIELTSPGGSLGKHPILSEDKRIVEVIPAIYYHLQVVNRSIWRTEAKNCRVLLTHIFSGTPENPENLKSIVIETAFHWAPANLKPPSLTVFAGKPEVFDFVKIIQGRNQGRNVLLPCVRHHHKEVTQFGKPNEAVFFVLSIIADHYTLDTPKVFKVMWNGSFTVDNKNSMEIEPVSSSVIVKLL